jgi:hypothetical protein
LGLQKRTRSLTRNSSKIPPLSLVNLFSFYNLLRVCLTSFIFGFKSSLTTYNPNKLIILNLN